MPTTFRPYQPDRALSPDRPCQRRSLRRPTSTRYRASGLPRRRGRLLMPPMICYGMRCRSGTAWRAHLAASTPADSVNPAPPGGALSERDQRGLRTPDGVMDHAAGFALTEQGAKASSLKSADTRGLSSKGGIIKPRLRTSRVVWHSPKSHQPARASGPPFELAARSLAGSRPQNVDALHQAVAIVLKVVIDPHSHLPVRHERHLGGVEHAQRA